MKVIRNIAVGLTVATWANLALAQDLVIYPSQGQDQEQQGADEYKCYGWAKDRSGFDPMATPRASKPPPRKKASKGGLARGAVGGAVIGGILGGSSGAKKDTGRMTGTVITRQAAVVFFGTCTSSFWPGMANRLSRPPRAGYPVQSS